MDRGYIRRGYMQRGLGGHPSVDVHFVLRVPPQEFLAFYHEQNERTLAEYLRHFGQPPSCTSCGEHVADAYDMLRLEERVEHVACFRSSIAQLTLSADKAAYAKYLADLPHSM